MYKKKDFLAIIPARAGSKRIPNKNLQVIGNTPLIEFTIKSAQSSICLSNIIISSNDKKVIRLAKKLGLEVPFVRPIRLSTDNASTSSVIFHAVKWFKKKHKNLPKNIILLQPTSPFRTATDINKSINQFAKSRKKTLVSVCIPFQNPNDFLIKSKNGKYKRLKIIKTRNSKYEQKNSEIFFIDGGIYITTTEQFLKTKDIIGSDPELFVTKQSHAIDIDTSFDLDLARAVYNNNSQK